MQCATFHRQALSDPLRLAPETLKHAGGCPSCARFYRDLCRRESALYQSLGQPVPGALASPGSALTAPPKPPPEPAASTAPWRSPWR